MRGSRACKKGGDGASWTSNSFHFADSLTSAAPTLARTMERDLAEANTRLRELDSLDAANRGLREEVCNVATLS